MKFYETFWPWKRFREDALKIALLKQALEEEAFNHQRTQKDKTDLINEVKAHQAKAAEREGHVRKMVQIIAIKGGIIG